MSRSVLITGASSGIGEALAYEYARNGANLVLLARRADRLAAVAGRAAVDGRRVIVRCGDVNDDEAVRAAVAAAEQEFGRLDIVFANAGFSVSGRFENLTLADYRRQIETNVFGVIRTAYASLEALKRSGGRLALLGSVAGYVAAPGLSPYSMSKFAVRAFAESLHEELRPHGISVTLISPGFVDSEIRRLDREGVFQDTRPEPVPSWLRVRTDVAARQMIRAVDRRRREVIITSHGKLLVQLARHTPWTLRTLARALTPKFRKV